MKNITGSGSSEGADGVTTLTVRQSSLCGWNLLTPTSVYLRR
jgi:hypothetical protein